jgi:hypothetical protein
MAVMQRAQVKKEKKLPLPYFFLFLFPEVNANSTQINLVYDARKKIDIFLQFLHQFSCDFAIFFAFFAIF